MSFSLTSGTFQPNIRKSRTRSKSAPTSMQNSRTPSRQALVMRSLRMSQATR